MLPPSLVYDKAPAPAQSPLNIPYGLRDPDSDPRATEGARGRMIRTKQSP